MNYQINSLLQDAINNIEKNNFVEAKILLSKILNIEPENFDALNIIGVINGNENNHLEALNFFKKAQKIRPDDSLINFNLAKSFSETGDDLEAIKYYQISIKLDKNHLGSLLNLGKSLEQLKKYDEALIYYDQAIKLKPDFFEANYNKGNTLSTLKRNDEALIYYDQAIKLKPDFFEAYNNRGTTFESLKRYDDALFNYDQAIKLKPDFFKAYYNKGNIFIDLKRYDEALLNYEKALKLKPDYEYLFGMCLNTKILMCDWQNYKDDVENLLLQISKNKKSCRCLQLLGLNDTLSIQYKSSEIWINDKHPFNFSLGPILKSKQRDKIKIGYYSPDFREHPVTNLIIELLELHNKNQFELFGFYFGPPDSSQMNKRVLAAFNNNKFFDVGLKTDKDIALMSREIEIDIAVDLAGFTKYARTDIFAYRAAPIQVNYLGYSGTMAADYMDYIIADQIIIPPESQKYYHEKVVYLPNSYQPNDRKREISKKIFTKEELDLPKEGFVFCCFNNNFKIIPPTFDGWMRILKSVNGSVLWLFQENQIAASNLRKEAEFRGVNPNRLIFAKRTNLLSEHLARYREADLFLDTLPYNAHTTTSDALWAGLPVLTCMGKSFASRVAASLLNAIELPELITTTQEQYEALAIELATTPEKLRSIKQKLERNKLTTALFDTLRFTKYIEAAYKQMYERYQADLPPNNIYIQN